MNIEEKDGERYIHFTPYEDIPIDIRQSMEEGSMSTQSALQDFKDIYKYCEETAEESI